jgi:hypothetical protein
VAASAGIERGARRGVAHRGAGHGLPFVYYGASLAALDKLARTKGYSLALLQERQQRVLRP